MNSLPSLVTTGKSLQPFGSVFDFLGFVFVTWCFILTLLVNHSKYSEKSGKYLKSNQESTSDGKVYALKNFMRCGNVRLKSNE